MRWYRWWFFWYIFASHQPCSGCGVGGGEDWGCIGPKVGHQPLVVVTIFPLPQLYSCGEDGGAGDEKGLKWVSKGGNGREG